MVILDFLRAAVECWITFVTRIIQKASLYASHLDIRSRSYNSAAIRDLSRVNRDLRLAIQDTFDAARLALNDDDPPSRRLREIELEVRAKLRAVENKVNDFLTSLESTSDLTKAIVDEDQARSVKRLTLLAAIFLPLSLSSSLLSMQSRAARLGLLWYDYFGICSLLFLILVVVYQLMHLEDIFQVSGATTIGKVLSWAKNKSSYFEQIMRFLLYFFEKRPRTPLALFIQYSKIPVYAGFWILVVISFWVGMFSDVGLGLRILGYGSPGFAGLFIMVAFLESWTTMSSLPRFQ